jgi:translation initiation factor 1
MDEKKESGTMKKNLFEMGADFGKGWASDNKKASPSPSSSPCDQLLAPEKHRLHFAREKRRGKTVTIVKPFCLDKDKLQSLLKTLKQKLGVGGTMKENTLEFQGEAETKLRVHLEAMRYRFKR